MVITYQTNGPKGWCGDPKRGAALGRVSRHADGRHTYAAKLHLLRVRIDNQGYDCNGTYFGHGAPLYWCSSDDDAGTIDWVFRVDKLPGVSLRDCAKQQVLDMYPNVWFYR
jgi:hypothetical protein